MSTTIEWADIILAVVSILAAGGFALLLKNVANGYRRPNGKKGGVVSFDTTVAFATITVIALTTKDWFLTGLTVVLAYLIGRSRLAENQHYMYQVVLGAIIGVVIPYAIFYLYYKKVHGSSGSGEYYREEYEDKPERAIDERHEADAHTELRLEDIDDHDIPEM